MSDLPQPVPDPGGQGEWIPLRNTDGRIYWVNHVLKTTAWEAPQPRVHAPTRVPSYGASSGAYTDSRLNPQAQQQAAGASYSSRPPQVAPGDEELPAGWESRFDSTGRKYYIDHASKKTHWSIPPYLLSAGSSSLQRASTFNQPPRPAAAPPLQQSVSFRAQPSYLQQPSYGAAAGAVSPPSAPPSAPSQGAEVDSGSHYPMEDFRRMYSNSQYQANADGAQQRAITCAECVVCFDDMYKEPAGVFTLRGRRTCPHFLHYRCAIEIKDSSRGGANCPICRRKFDSVLQVPDIDTDHAAWFKAVDLSGENSLQQKEVLEVLKAQFCVDYERLEKELPDLFKKWDVSGDGCITQSEMLDPQRGLLQHIRREFLTERNDVIPDIRDNKDAWFDHFDYDKSNSLEQAEIVRALIKTFKLSDDRDKHDQMRAVVNAVWGVFDSDGNGTIDKDEFTSPDGLADAVIASMAHMRL